MERLSCSIHPSSNFPILEASRVKFQHSKSHYHFVITSQQHLKWLHLSTRQPLKPIQWVASTHKRAKTFALVTITTDTQHPDENTSLAQDTIGPVEVHTDRHPPRYTAALDNSKPLAASLDVPLSLNAHPQLVEGNAIPGVLLASEGSTIANVSNASELSEEAKPDNVHAPIDCISQFKHPKKNERMLHRKRQQLTYLFAAVASSLCITSLAGASVYYRFAWQMEGGEVPWTEMFGTFSLALGAAVGMEYWARWAHRALWHASLWSMHESHHRHRDGPFELNDVFAIINAVPAIALMAFGFLHKGLVPGLCFGAGLGITVFGIAYMFVHDGLVHRRFPVGPIADVPYFQRVAAAHQLHHADRFNGVPYGLFLGPMELEEVGGRTELEELVRKRRREKRNPIEG